MELTTEQKKAMVEARLTRYKQQLYDLEIDRQALLAVDDVIGIDSIDKRIESLKKAYKAVEGMI